MCFEFQPKDFRCDGGQNSNLLQYSFLNSNLERDLLNDGKERLYHKTGHLRHRDQFGLQQKLCGQLPAREQIEYAQEFLDLAQCKSRLDYNW